MGNFSETWKRGTYVPTFDPSNAVLNITARDPNLLASDSSTAKIPPYKHTKACNQLG
jgi:hypothetical protein